VQRNGTKMPMISIESRLQTIRKLRIKKVETDEMFEDDADVLIAARGA
jgi:hypothetical protein